MRIFELFERRADVMEMLLFAYAVAVASLVCIHMPIFGAGAVILLVLALLLAGYGLWWMSLPDTRNASLFFGLLLLGLFLRSGLLALIVAFFFFSKMRKFPLALDSSAWYSSTSALFLLALAAIAVYSFRSAIRGYSKGVPDGDTSSIELPPIPHSS